MTCVEGSYLVEQRIKKFSFIFFPLQRTRAQYRQPFDMSRWFLLVAVVALITGSEAEKARFCVTSSEERVKCLAMMKYFANHDIPPGVDCVRGLDKYDCVQKIRTGEADLLSCCAMDAYVAGKYHNLAPFLMEKHTTEPGWSYAYYALAVVRKSEEIYSLGDLRGKRSCHPGVNQNVGWFYPIYHLYRGGHITNGDCTNNVANLAKFFKESCLPGARNPIWNPDGEYDNLCGLCNGKGEDFCRTTDPYAGYVGALKCLVERRGDIAFVRETTFSKAMTAMLEFVNLTKDYELLCPDGRRKSIDSSIFSSHYKKCNWGKIPERVLMTSPHMTSEQRKLIHVMLLQAQKGPETFNLFDSSVYGGENLIFRDDTKSLEPVGDKNTYEKYLGDYFGVRKYHNLCNVPPVKWCTISKPELQKCQRMRDALAARFVTPEIQCLEETDTGACMKAIGYGKADVINLDSGDLFKWGDGYHPKVLMSEIEDGGASGYYGVAVVKKRNAQINFDILDGKKSCHGAIGSAAGWNTPAGILLQAEKIVNPPNCNLASSIGDFFIASCAPGALTLAFDPRNDNPKSLCSLCDGPSNNKCARNHKEPFYGHTGAFRCMASGAGDVAFVKHSTVIENTEGRNMEDWAKDLHFDDFELICRDNTRKSPNDYKNCYWAKVPSNAIVTDGSKSPEEVERIVYQLNLAQYYCGRKKRGGFYMFSSDPDTKDLLFSDTAEGLLRVPEENSTYRKYLGHTADFFDTVYDPGCQP